MGPPPEDSPVASMPDSWRTLATVSGASAEEVFDPVCFIENEETDTQVTPRVNPGIVTRP